MNTLGELPVRSAATRCHWGSTEPLPRGVCARAVLKSCPGQRWRLCFVLFAVSCLALGSLTCSHRWNGFISPFWPLIGIVEIVLTHEQCDG